MAQGKSAEAFRTISEATEEVGVPQHVLRHWEEAFGQIRPMRRAGGRRYYRPHDIDILRGVKVLLYDRRYTTKGVQQIFKENGAKHVAEIGRGAVGAEPMELKPLEEDLVLAAEDIAANGVDASRGSDDADELLVLTSPLPAARGENMGMSPEVRARLAALLERLERVQDALDEANLALEAIEAGAGDARKAR